MVPDDWKSCMNHEAPLLITAVRLLGFVGVFVWLVAVVGCKGAESIPGELAYLGHSSTDKHPRSDTGRLWWIDGPWCYTPGVLDIWRVDVDDPRAPRAELVRRAGECEQDDILAGPRYFAVVNNRTLVRYADELDVDGRVYELPGGGWGGIEPIDDQVASLPVCDTQTGNAQLLFVDVEETAAQESLVLKTVIDLGIACDNEFAVRIDTRLSDARLFVWFWAAEELAIFDVSNVEAPILMSRVPVQVPDRTDLALLAAHGNDVIFLSEDYDPTHAVTWFEVNEELSGLKRISTASGFYSGLYYTGPGSLGVTYQGELAGEYLLIPVRRPDRSKGDRSHTLVFALDPEDGLKLVREVKYPAKGIGGIAVDESRNLAFVGGEGIQILDLQQITTGDPWW